VGKFNRPKWKLAGYPALPVQGNRWKDFAREIERAVEEIKPPGWANQKTGSGAIAQLLQARLRELKREDPQARSGRWRLGCPNCATL